MVHQEYKELISVKALTALDADETQALEAHLEHCFECRAGLDEWNETAGMLAFDARAAEPSPQLRERILAAVRKAPDSSPEGSARIETTNNVAPLRSKRRQREFSVQHWMAIAAAVAFVAFMTSIVALWSQNKAARQELAYLTIQVKDAQQQLARQREAIEIVTTPGTRTVELSGTDVAPKAHATVAYDRSGRVVLLANNLPPPPEAKGYQLWFVAGGQLYPGKVFSPDASGNGSVEDQIPAAARVSTGFAITLEAENGVETPTGAKYLVSQ